MCPRHPRSWIEKKVFFITKTRLCPYCDLERWASFYRDTPSCWVGGRVFTWKWPHDSLPARDGLWTCRILVRLYHAGIAPPALQALNELGSMTKCSIRVQVTKRNFQLAPRGACGQSLLLPPRPLCLIVIALSTCGQLLRDVVVLFSDGVRNCPLLHAHTQKETTSNLVRCRLHRART